MPARADDVVRVVGPDDPVTGHGTVTYRSLLDQAVPDAEQLASIRHINGDAEHGEAPASIDIGSIRTATVLSNGAQTIWVLADLGEGGNLGSYTLLAVFDDAHEPRLIDAAEVDTDRFASFLEGALEISPRDEALILDHSHFNAGEAYNRREMVFLNDGRLSVAADVFLFGRLDCAEKQEETVQFTAGADAARFWPVTAVVTRMVETLPPDCPDPDGSNVERRDFAAVYAWDDVSKSYVTRSSELEELYALDAP